MKMQFLYLFILFPGYLFSQKADNALHGYFEEKGGETFYKYFKFDGNGKVLIAGMDYGDYFTRNDSVIVYPDKSIFIFKIQKGNQLKGISNWVDKEIWTFKKDSIVENKRTNPEKAAKQAMLLAEYYDKTKRKSNIDALFSDNTENVNEELCNKGLSKACLNVFGMKMLMQNPDLLKNPSKIPSKKIKPDADLIALSQKIVSLGDPEGYTVLGSYYYILGLKTEANAAWDKAIEMGSRKAEKAKIMIEFAETLDAETKK